MNKKAQSQIITTVLIILLVLAAIVIVWQVVRKTVETGAEGITSATDCFGVEMEVTSGDSSSVIVMRKPGGTADAVSYKILVDGTTVGTTNSREIIKQLETSTATFNDPLDPGTYKVQASAIVEDQACGLSTEFEVVVA